LRAITAAIVTLMPISRFVALIFMRLGPSLVRSTFARTGIVLLAATAWLTRVRPRFRRSWRTSAVSAALMGAAVVGASGLAVFVRARLGFVVVAVVVATVMVCSSLYY
jgi:hypothetical protein